MSENVKLSGPADAALNRLQDTQLSSMEEALFKAWTKANDIKDPDAPDDIVDYRGIYKHTGGKVMPHGQLKRFTERINDEDRLQRALHEQMMDRIAKAAGSKEDAERDKFKAERQDITHKQKMDMESLKLKRLPHDVKMKEHDVTLKERDAVLKDKDIEKMRVGNEGKELDFARSLVSPGGSSGTTTGTSTPKKTA